MWVSQAEAARHSKVNVSKQRINTLVRQGRLQVNEFKQVDLAEVLAEFSGRLNPAWDGNPLVDQPPRQEQPGGDSEQARDARPEYTAVSTELKRTEAQIKQFELDRLRGMYLPKSEVEQAMDAAGRSLVQQLETLPHLADELFAIAREGTVADLRRKLKEKVRQFRQALSDRLVSDAGQDSDAALA